MGDKKRMTAKKILKECPSCGASFDEMLAACPYCGSMNVKGAQAEYMNKLENIREDMEDLKAVPIEETKKELKKQTRFVLIVLGIIAGLLLLLVAWEWFFIYREEDRDRQADYIWQQKTFPVLNELYEQEKYEEMMEICYQAYEEDRPISAWEHLEFCSAMELFLDIEETWARELAGETLTNWDYYDLLYAGLRVENYEKSTTFSAQEKEKLAPYVEKIRADFKGRWDFTEEDLALFEKEAEENYGYISYETIEEYVDEWMERNNKQ